MDTVDLQRRKFLLAAGLGSAGTIAVLAATDKLPAAAAKADAAAAEPEATKGYRASPHVLNYYRTTKV
ncbi:MAG TPA: formate dehydrogenase [Novimethylophilus sp.]|uniref:formate dehydrogenase n=1 Tax=Novimethylophilus sp. TaxID=2137426 RepID=UPI002F3EA7C0